MPSVLLTPGTAPAVAAAAGATSVEPMPRGAGCRKGAGAGVCMAACTLLPCRLLLVCRHRRQGCGNGRGWSGRCVAVAIRGAGWAVGRCRQQTHAAHQLSQLPRYARCSVLPTPLTHPC
eukprot:1160152-Pelagomonas_calceolata.AAC.2